MAIKAKFAEGATSATTRSLFQWDYGQKLEIEAADLPATFEVHFSCRGMSEAAVVPCSATNGVAIVTVPDRCLEQSAEITAWVYEIEGESGTTTKVITIPVVQRARPSTGDEVPASAVDKYTELITAVNAALAALRDGTVTVAKATNAANADYATSAGNAGTANKASTIDANGVIENVSEFGIVQIAGGSMYVGATPSGNGDYTHKTVVTGSMVNLTSGGNQFSVWNTGDYALLAYKNSLVYFQDGKLVFQGEITASPSTGDNVLDYSPVITRKDLVNLGLISE